MTTLTITINDQIPAGKDFLSSLQKLSFVSIKNKTNLFAKKELKLTQETEEAIAEAQKGNTVKFSSFDEYLNATGCV